MTLHLTEQQWNDLQQGTGGAESHSKGSKFRNKPTTADGVRFASQREAERYQQLDLLEKAGYITELVYEKKQLRFPLVVNGFLICTYEGDFSYRENGVVVLEDVKGVRTPLYVVKRKLMLALLGIEILET